MDQDASLTTEQQVKHDKRLLNRRDVLKHGALASAGLLAAPMLNRGRFRIFANSPVEYTSRAVDLVQQSVVIDMLGPFTLDFRSEEHTSELQSQSNLVCRLLLEKKKKKKKQKAKINK